MNILAIDPGNIESAYCVLDESYKPIEFDKIKNDELLSNLPVLLGNYEITDVAIEMIASYGMAVGKEVFDTCVWIGRFVQKCESLADVSYVYRKEVKMNLCGSMKAKDSNIRMALMDRFGEVGTKNNKGFFYGFRNDIWSACAVGVTFKDRERK